jgi:hypothetical protein
MQGKVQSMEMIVFCFPANQCASYRRCPQALHRHQQPRALPLQLLPPQTTQQQPHPPLVPMALLLHPQLPLVLQPRLQQLQARFVTDCIGLTYTFSVASLPALLTVRQAASR